MKPSPTPAGTVLMDSYSSAWLGRAVAVVSVLVPPNPVRVQSDAFTVTFTPITRGGLAGMPAG